MHPTKEQVEALRALAENATQGEWEWRTGNQEEDYLIGLWSGDTEIMNFGSTRQYYPVAGTEPGIYDERFIAAANPEAIRALCELELEALDHPATTPQEAIGASSAEGACGCATCSPLEVTKMRMIVCGICGNKRCPHATDHRNACTGSNEPGQPGSSYGTSAPARPAPPGVERDAGRYRFIRNVPEDQLGLAGRPCVAVPYGAKKGHYVSEDDADAAIDKAMKESGKA